MADENEDSKVNQPHQSLPFVEVLCNSSGKYRRFAIGTHAGFALTFINTKAELHPMTSSSHIEAVKEGEEPIVFGPTAPLVNFGPAWTLQTVTFTSKGVAKGAGLNGVPTGVPQTYAKGSEDLQSPFITSNPITPLYIGKIFLALFLLFAFGAAFTLILENLPQLILQQTSENI